MALAVSNRREELIAEALVDLETPNNVRISPSGRHVVYTLTPFTRKEEYYVSSLWLAEIGKEFSARQLTTGKFHDDRPQWSPNGESIAFLSDRAKRGELSAIHLLSLQGGEALPITKADNKSNITSFSWSPNGCYIAFLSPDEKTAEQEAKEKDRDDVRVYGEKWPYNRLRCLDILASEITTLFNDDAHVKDFAWNEESTEIAYVLHETPDMNSAGYKGIKFERISISCGTRTPICDFPGPTIQLIWFSTHLYFLAGVAPTKCNTSSTVYKVCLTEKTWRKYPFGIDNCATGLRWTGRSVVVQVQQGLRDQIHLLNGDLIYNGLHELTAGDILIKDEDPILVIARSFTNSPTEVYSTVGGIVCQLSQHGQGIVALKLGYGRPFPCTAADGTQIDGVFTTPTEERKPWPTIVLIHGGPYSRVTIGFNTPNFYWTPWLISAGYAVLCPNYRGSSSRGEAFASAARGAMGTVDYSDIICMLRAAISDGLIDAQRVAIGGWSQGGFLSYLSVTRADFPFRATVCGAGVSDWDMMSMTSQAVRFEAELAGRAPWESEVGNVEARHGSPVWHMKSVKTPVLILHGEEDPQVPLTQAIAFHRGCLRHGIPCEMVTYPREGHMIPDPSERLHMLDILKRMRRFYDLHMGS